MKQLRLKIRKFKKQINHPSQKAKIRTKKLIKRLSKLPLIVRYIVAAVLVIVGIFSLANPLLPGWLLLLVGTKMISNKYYNYIKKIFVKHEKRSYQEQIFDLLSQ